MKLPLVSGSYSTNSPAAAAMACINLFPELIQDPNVPPLGNTPSPGNAIIGKNIGYLRGCPGRHIFRDLTAIDAAAHPIRCVYANPGGTRLFVAAGTKYMELDSSGNLIGSVRTIADDASHTPVTMVANGTQLFIVASGSVYCDNGAGPILQNFNVINYVDLQIGYSGVVTTLGTFVGWISGDKFNLGMVGQTITIGGTGYVIAQVEDPQSIIITTTAGFQTSAYTQGDPLTVNSQSNPFTAVQNGTTLNVTGGTGFTVQSVTVNSVDEWGNAHCSASMGVIGSVFGVGNYNLGAVGGINGAFLDGYFIVPKPNSKFFNISNLNNGLSWDSLDAGAKESWPDFIRSVFTTPQFLYVFGTDSLEVWQNTGGNSFNTFPLERINSASQKYGIVSAWSPTAIAGKVFFLATSSQGQLVACMFNGTTVQRISTFAEEATWKSYGAPVNCYSYSYVEDGHQFWVFSISGKGWAYDLTSATLGFYPWTQRAQWNGATFTSYDTQFCAFVQAFGTGKYLTGGINSGIIYESSLGFFDDAGSDMGAQKVLPFLYDDGKRLYFGRMELECETGITVNVDVSKDKGQTFANLQTMSPTASNRMFLPNCGSALQAAFRLTLHGQTRMALIDLDLEVSLGVN